MIDHEPSYWADSGYEGQIASMIRECWGTLSVAYQSDSKLKLAVEMVDVLGLVVSKKVKEALPGWLKNNPVRMVKTGSPMKDHSTNFSILLAYTKKKLSFIHDTAEDAGLLAKPKQEVKRGRGKIYYPPIKEEKD